jgi:hypothetical protein
MNDAAGSGADDAGDKRGGAERAASSGEGAETALRAMLRKRRQDGHAEPEGRKTQPQQQQQPPEPLPDGR